MYKFSFSADLLIHSPDPLSRSLVIIILFTYVACLYVHITFQNLANKKKSSKNATVTVSLAEWIIDDICLASTFIFVTEII